MVAEHDRDATLLGRACHLKRSAASECMEVDYIGLFGIENMNESMGAHRITLSVQVPQILYLLSHREPPNLQSMVDVHLFLSSWSGHHDVEALTLLLSREALDVHLGTADRVRPIAERHMNDFHSWSMFVEIRWDIFIRPGYASRLSGAAR